MRVRRPGLERAYLGLDPSAAKYSFTIKHAAVVAPPADAETLRSAFAAMPPPPGRGRTRTRERK